MSEHSRFSPSAASRWLTCTASMLVDVSHIKERSSPAAEKGTFLHSVCEAYLKEQPPPLIPPNIRVSREDEASVSTYVNYVNSREGEKLIELKTMWVDDCGGTADAVVINDTHVEIIDYKSGFFYVSPVENPQLIIYALGVRKALESQYATFQDFKLTIVQPAQNNISSWSLTNKVLDEWEAEIKEVIDKINAHDVDFVPSEKACKWCPARTVCPALHELADQAVMQDFKDETSPSLTLSMTEKLDRIPLLKALCDAWEAEAFATLSDGDSIKGYKLAEGRKGDRKYTSEVAVEKKLAELQIPVGLTHEEPKIKSPAKIEKALKQISQDATWLNQFTSRADGKLKIVRSEDDRKSVNPKDKALDDFADETE